MEETLKKPQPAPAAEERKRTARAHSGKINLGAHALKFWLMPFVCFASFGFPTRFGSVVSILSGFAPLCFFILCGYFNVTSEPKRTERHLKKVIRRSGLFFAGLTLVCLALNLFYYLYVGWDMGELLLQLFRKRTLFNFVVLCAWPFQMGETIWFIQSLFYAYVLLYALHRTGWLYRPRVIPALLALCTLLMVFTGEGAGLIRFRFLGYPYLPPNALTRALPYLLLGAELARCRGRLRARDPKLYLALVPIGLALALGEYVLLSRLGLLVTTSHALGLGLTAFGLCAWVLLFPRHRSKRLPAIRGRAFARRIYALSQPLAFLVLVPLSMAHPALAAVVQALGGVAMYPLCFLAALVIDMAAAMGQEPPEGPF